MSRLKHLLRLQYGDALAADRREDGDVPVFGSNGVVGTHSGSNTMAPVVLVGRKGSFGKVVWSDSAGFCIDTAYFIDERSCHGDLRFAFYALQGLGLDTLSRDTGVPSERTHARRRFRAGRSRTSGVWDKPGPSRMTRPSGHKRSRPLSVTDPDRCLRAGRPDRSETAPSEATVPGA